MNHVPQDIKDMQEQLPDDYQVFLDEQEMTPDEQEVMAQVLDSESPIF